MFKVIKEFFIKKFFFRIDPEEKRIIREKVMDKDHRVYKVLIPLVMFLEATMLIASFVKAGPAPDDVLEHIYRGFYGAFIIGGFIILLFLEHFYKTRQLFKYFLFVSLLLLLIMCWGVGISILDSKREGTSILVYFAIALIGTSAFLTLEPWVATAASLLSAIVYDIIYFCFPVFNAKPNFYFFGASVVIVGLSIVTATFNFIRRTDAIKLELKVSNMNESLSEKALVDDLTRVFNRRYLTEHIDVPLDYSDNGSGVMMIDIDHFKRLNDTYGHQVGDECLSLLGIAINNLIRDKEAYCVRYGGEEFLIFFKNISKGDLEIYGETLRARIEKMKVSIAGGVQIKYTISLGLAKAKDGISYNNLINQADEALYKAKETRNTVCMSK